jgi:hypothetical protein
VAFFPCARRNVGLNTDMVCRRFQRQYYVYLAGLVADGLLLMSGAAAAALVAGHGGSSGIGSCSYQEQQQQFQLAVARVAALVAASSGAAGAVAALVAPVAHATCAFALQQDKSSHVSRWVCTLVQHRTSEP